MEPPSISPNDTNTLLSISLNNTNANQKQNPNPEVKKVKAGRPSEQLTTTKSLQGMHTQIPEDEQPASVKQQTDEKLEGGSMIEAPGETNNVKCHTEIPIKLEPDSLTVFTRATPHRDSPLKNSHTEVKKEPATYQKSPITEPKPMSWATFDTPSQPRSPDPLKTHSLHRRRRPRGSRGKGRNRKLNLQQNKTQNQQSFSTPQTDKPSLNKDAPQFTPQVPPYIPNSQPIPPTAPFYFPMQNPGYVQQSTYNFQMLSAITGMLLQNITVCQSILSMIYQNQTTFSTAPLQMRTGYYM